LGYPGYVFGFDLKPGPTMSDVLDGKRDGSPMWSTGVNGGKWHRSGIQNADDVRGNFDRYIGTLDLFED
jgi:hypothetical protein